MNDRKIYNFEQVSTKSGIQFDINHIGRRVSTSSIYDIRRYNLIFQGDAIFFFYI